MAIRCVVDAEDQFIDAASQSFVQHGRAFQLNLILQIKPLTRRLNLLCSVDLHLKPNLLVALISLAPKLQIKQRMIGLSVLVQVSIEDC